MSRLMFMLLLFPAVAIAQRQLPNDVDLKAAYCIPIVRSHGQIAINDCPEAFRNSLQDGKDKAAVNLRRLTLYLLPRFSQLDVTPLLGASKSAEEDMEWMMAEVRKCDKMTPIEEALKCMAVETETSKRLRSCNVLSFFAVLTQL